METIKVKVFNATGSSHVIAELTPSTGLLRYQEGEISHLIAERMVGKTVFEHVEPKLALVTEPKILTPSVDRSPKSRNKKVKDN